MIQELIISIKTAEDEYIREKNREQLIKLYIPIIKHYIYKLWMQGESFFTTDELLSEGLFILNKAIDSYDLRSPIKFSTYAGMKIKNGILQYKQRKIAKEKYISEAIRESISPVVESEETRYHKKRMIERLYEALDKLTFRERKIIQLFFGLEEDSKTLAEISSLLELSEKNVYYIKERAIKKLANLLRRR